MVGGWHIVAEDEGRMAKFSAHESEQRTAGIYCSVCVRYMLVQLKHVPERWEGHVPEKRKL